MTRVLEHLLEAREQYGAGFLVLLDPDRLLPDELARRAVLAADAGADAILFGTSLMMGRNAAAFCSLKAAVDIPIICFPGGAGQVVPEADAILLLSMISGRNPELLIGEHVKAAPLIKESGIEPISTGYMLVESGSLTSVEFMSFTQPMPRQRPDIAVAHALAAEYIGMKMIYLEAGSGACQSVPVEMIEAVANNISLPIIVGGGIRDPQTAQAKVEAGASFVVVGQVVEGEAMDLDVHLRAMAAAVHIKSPKVL